MMNHFTCMLSYVVITAFIGMAGPNAGSGLSIDFIPETPAIDSIGTLPDSLVIAGVRITGAVNLDAYQFDTRYDTSILKFKSAMEDNPFASIDNILKLNGGSTIGFICKAKSQNSSILNVANTLIGEDSAQAPEGAGIVALLQFTVVRQALCTLHIESGIVMDCAGLKDTVKAYTSGVCRAQTPTFSIRNARYGMRNPAHAPLSVKIDILGRVWPIEYKVRSVALQKGRSVLSREQMSGK